MRSKGTRAGRAGRPGCHGGPSLRSHIGPPCGHPREGDGLFCCRLRSAHSARMPLAALAARLLASRSQGARAAPAHVQSARADSDSRPCVIWCALNLMRDSDSRARKSERVHPMQPRITTYWPGFIDFLDRGSQSALGTPSALYGDPSRQVSPCTSPDYPDSLLLPTPPTPLCYFSISQDVLSALPHQ
jgi:hypothetical protein